MTSSIEASKRFFSYNILERGQRTHLFRCSPLTIMTIRACCHEATFSKTLAGVFFWCLFMYRNGTKNLKNLGRRFHDWKLVWSFCLIYRVKRVQNSQKKCDFPKLAQNPPKNRNAWTKCLSNHFGGCFARFLESVLRLGRSKCHFLALWAPRSKNGLQKPCETPPKMVG